MRRRAVTFAVLIMMSVLLVLSAVRSSGNYALSGLLLAVLSLVPFFASFERRRPQARELVPIAVLAAVAALGRVLFAPLPFVKPTSAVIIVTGIAFGPQAGFMTGAMAALASNIFFGQGPFTPWQMFAWGLMGFTAGAFSRFLNKTPVVCVFGFLWGFAFGWIMDCYQILGFVNPINLKSAALTVAASFYPDLTHAVSNAAFLFCIAGPWSRILKRIRLKYGLMEPDNPKTLF